jgi:nucleoside phosphorylase
MDQDLHQQSVEYELKADLLIVTVNDHERDAVLAVFDPQGSSKLSEVEERTYRNLGVINGTHVWHAISEMASGTPGGMQQTVEKAIRALKPTAVIAVGVAFGVDEETQALGTILVSTQLCPYENAKIATDKQSSVFSSLMKKPTPVRTFVGQAFVDIGHRLMGQPRAVFQARGDRPSASSRLVSYFRGTSYNWSDSLVKFGHLLTGEKLVDNLAFRNQLVSVFPTSIGGEMEAAGLAVSAADNKTDWIVIKAICDWADGNKKQEKEQRQEQSAKNAARFLMHSLQQCSLAISRTTVQVKTSTAAESGSNQGFFLTQLDELYGPVFSIRSRIMSLSKQHYDVESALLANLDSGQTTNAGLKIYLRENWGPARKLYQQLGEICASKSYLADPDMIEAFEIIASQAAWFDYASTADADQEVARTIKPNPESVIKSFTEIESRLERKKQILSSLMDLSRES